MKTINVQNSTETQIDYLVAQCEYKTAPDDLFIEFMHAPYIRDFETGNRVPFTPSTDPAQAWPIIDREGISVLNKGYLNDAARKWLAYRPCESLNAGKFGSTGLIAAMRNYVASQLGDEVEVPDELG